MAIDNNNNSDDIQKKSVEEIAREQEKSRLSANVRNYLQSSGEQACRKHT